MNDIHWTPLLELHPLQLADPAAAVDCYTKSLLNKYLSDLSGILLRVNKQSLRLKSAPDLSRTNDGGNFCLVRLHPEQPIIKIRVQIEVTVFRPRPGLILDAVVTVSKPQRLVCRHGDDFAVFVGVPLQCASDVPQPLPPDLEQVFPQDRVQVEVLRVQVSAVGDSMSLTGRVVSLLKRGKIGKNCLGMVDSVNEIEACPTSTKEKKTSKLIAVVENSEVEEVSKKKTHKKRQQKLNEDDRLFKREPNNVQEKESGHKKEKHKKKREKRHAEETPPTRTKKICRRQNETELVTVKTEAREQSPDIFSSSEDEIGRRPSPNFNQKFPKSEAH